MSQTLTIDDIWKLFQETNRLFRESELRTEHADERRRQEAEQADERRRQEAEQADERRRQEAERERQETRRMMQESRAEADRRMQETDRVVKEVSKQIDDQFGSRWGEFVEALAAPACKLLFAQRGIPVHKVFHQVKAKFPGNRHLEIDLMVANADAVVLVEVRSKLRHNDVREHLTRMAEFKDFFSEYADKRVMGAVAGIVIEESVDRFAMNEGLFVIVQSGETVRLANDEAFVPRTW